MKPGRLIPEGRRREILAALEQQQRVTVDGLAAALAVSKETIRRDLTLLADRDLLRKVHGGAMILQTAREGAFEKRARFQLAEKQAIARHAAGLFEAGDSLFIDAGSTTAVFAGELTGKRDLTVITNSLDVAARMWKGGGDNRVYLLGGQYHGEVSETLGPLALELIGRFQADHAVLTIGTVDAVQGFMDYNVDEATVAQAMIRQSRAVTVLADHTKLGRAALIKVCGMEAVRRLVTGEEPPEPVRRALDQAGVEVLVAR
jgi:DeoR family glycerol-3-phosphate regulon repressor